MIGGEVLPDGLTDGGELLKERQRLEGQKRTQLWATIPRIYHGQRKIPIKSAKVADCMSVSGIFMVNDKRAHAPPF